MAQSHFHPISTSPLRIRIVAVRRTNTISEFVFLNPPVITLTSAKSIVVMLIRISFRFYTIKKLRMEGWKHLIHYIEGVFEKNIRIYFPGVVLT
jgi:hypothetical protein